MENVRPPEFDPENVKRMLMSIAVGFFISVLTVLFQGFVSWLHHFSPEAIGGTAGAITHFVSWKTPPTA